jgi:hypothetical protein
MGLVVRGLETSYYGVSPGMLLSTWSSFHNAPLFTTLRKGYQSENIQQKGIAGGRTTNLTTTF